jgi:cell division protein ZapA
MDRTVVNVKILDRNYTVKCEDGEARDLETAAHTLDEHMRKVRQSGHINNSDSIAIVAGLNLAQELVATRRNLSNASTSNNQRIQAITDKCAAILCSEEKEA